MKIDDIIRLKEQGYSAEEIVSFNSIIDAEQVTSVAENSAQDIKDTINSAVKNAVQDFFRTSAQNGNPIDSIIQQGNSALASILRPEVGKNGSK